MSQIAPQAEVSEDVAIETSELTKSYGSLVAVDHLDLEVPTGSIYGLIGPNGAGKTTTFQVLATLLKPSSGFAWVMGHSTTEEPYEVRRRLGVMPDFFGVYDDVRVSEYLEFFARAYRLPPSTRDAVTRDLLELVDLSHKADAFVETLSRGMTQRLGLARALIHDPQVLVLDEPASGLDPRARVELRELLLELRAMGKTILVSSHILSELEEVCTHVGVIEKGKLLVQGSPSEILSGRADAAAFKLRVGEDEATAKTLEILLQHEAVSEVSQSEEGLEFFLSGDDSSAADLLARLAAAGIPIVEFARTRGGLEQLFLRITKGEVQ